MYMNIEKEVLTRFESETRCEKARSHCRIV